MKLAAEFSTLDFLEGREPATIRVETTELRDAEGTPIVRLTIEGLEFLVRVSDLSTLGTLVCL